MKIEAFHKVADYYPEILKQINKANIQIDIMSLSYMAGKWTDEINKILIEKVKKGVKDLYRRFLISRWFSPQAPLRILSKIRSWEDFNYIFHIGLYGIKLVSKLVSHEKTVNSKVLRV